MISNDPGHYYKPAFIYVALGSTVAAYNGKVQAIAQMGLYAGMPLWYDYDDAMPIPAAKIGRSMRKAFKRGIHWSVVRGLV